MRKATLLIGFVVITGSVAAAQEAKPLKRTVTEKAENFSTPSVATILKNASAAYTKVRTLKAEFTQNRQNPLLGSNTSSHGMLMQKKPDLILLKFNRPMGDIIVGDGKYFWVYYPSTDKRQVLRAPASMGGARGVDLQAQFLGDPTRKFTSTFNGIESVGGRKAYVLTMTPRENQGYKTLKVWVDAKDWLARRFIITENNGVVQDFTLSNLAVNSPINNSVFRFTPPADARIVTRP
ncbi:MAG TPA: outer membrane lipoprotein carrier protein LolA [Longimicrobiales bacterium]|nr:outer membrane lipoprotein carrier protein LolA [Longimicrobiales bacterium]